MYPPLQRPSWLAILVMAAGSVAADPVGAANPPSDRIGHQLGTIRFEVSGNEVARTHVVRGVKLLHHMMYIEADREFARAAEADPDCVLAHWGRAMAIIHPLWPDAPTAAELEQGWNHVVTALARSPRTPRERAYVGTMDAYYRDAAQRDMPARLKALDEAWARVAADFPDDMDAAAFSALFHLGPARFLPKDKSHRIQLEAGAIIQRILARIPDHPGAQHYKIHAFDFPLLADRALEICDQYGAIAPEVPHALHMPTHIFTRRGQWEKSIDFNRRAAEAARKLIDASGTTNSHFPHSLDYLVYAYLQRGQYREAEAIRQQLLTFRAPYETTNRVAMAFAFAAIPARCALERQDWAGAAKLGLREPANFPWGDPYLNCESITRFARALGAARSDQPDLARRELEELEQLGRRIAGAQPNSYWASQAQTQGLAAKAWLAFQRGEKDDAVALMRRAAELERGVEKEAVTPGEVLPATELLGDLLMQLRRPGDALAAYQQVLETSPNRLNSLLGAARAARESADPVVARKYYSDLLAVAAEADPECEARREAATFLGSNGGKKAE